MNRRSFLIGGGSVLALATGGYFALNLPGDQGSKPIIVGWQPPWANQGQLVEVLKAHSSSGAKPTIDFKPFTFGGPMTEAALGGQLDVILLGDHPALKLISKNPQWKIVSRLTNYRSALLVPQDSPLKSISDLQGKVVGTAIGSATNRDASKILSQVGLSSPKNMKFVNIDQAEHASVIAAGATGGRWGEFDAIATYDPTVALAVANGQARVLNEWASLGVVAASPQMLGPRKPELKAFLNELRQAYVDYARQPDLYDRRYLQDARLSLSPAILRSLGDIEPALKAKKLADISLRLSPAEMRALSANVNSAKQLGLLPSTFDERTAFEFVDL